MKCGNLEVQRKKGIYLPEGPEVRHSRDVLRSIIVNETIVGLEATSSGRYKSKKPNGLEEVLLNVMYDVPSRADVARVVVTEETVRDNVLPTLVPREVETPKRRARKESA